MGPQQISISCPPGTTFLDGALSYENSIKAECGPRQYRYLCGCNFNYKAFLGGFGPVNLIKMGYLNNNRIFINSEKSYIMDKKHLN